MTTVCCISVARKENGRIREYLIKMPDGECTAVFLEALRAKVKLGMLNVANMELKEDGSFEFSPSEYKSRDLGMRGILYTGDELYIGDDIIAIELSPQSMREMTRPYWLRSINRRFIAETVNHKLFAFDCDVTGLKAIHFGSGLRQIGAMTFDSANNLHSLRIPECVTSISVGAFAKCKRLEEVYLPDSIIYLGTGAFIECKRLSSVRLSKNTKHSHLEAEIFWGCTMLSDVVIPCNIKSFSDTTFHKCPQLTLSYEERVGILEYDSGKFNVYA